MEDPLGRVLSFVGIMGESDDEECSPMLGKLKRAPRGIARRILHLCRRCADVMHGWVNRVRHRTSRLYGWWWWRSVNRPWIDDDSYKKIVESLPDDAVGLDLGSADTRIRKGAITADIFPFPQVDVVCDAASLPFPDDHFDYVWSSAMLEHVPQPWKVAAEIVRTLKPGGLAIIHVPFLENVHSWPHDYYRYTPQGLRALFSGLEEVKSGVSAGPGQVLPDLLQYFGTGFSELEKGSVWINLWCIFVGIWVLPLRLCDRLMRRRPSYWKWARAFYFVGRKPIGSRIAGAA